jgi:hypothetical protein
MAIPVPVHVKAQPVVVDSCNCSCCPIWRRTPKPSRSPEEQKTHEVAIEWMESHHKVSDPWVKAIECPESKPISPEDSVS